MSFMRKLKRLIHKGGVKLGLIKTNSLRTITDDPRIKVPAEEYDRIRKTKQYYQDNLPKVEYWTIGGQKKRPLNSINIIKQVSQQMATLMFNEQCSIKVNDQALQAQLDEILKNTDFYLDAEMNLDPWIAMGSGAVRPYVQNDQIKLSWANAEDAYPLDANTTHVDQIALSRRIQKVENDTAVYYTLLEFHQWGSYQQDNQGNIDRPYTITNELYRSTDPNVIGDQVPLDSIDEYADLQKQTTFQHLKRPLFAFYRNPGANNKNLISPLGMGICDNCRTTLDDINRVHDGFAWDVKTGYRRITIPRSWMRRQNNMNGKPIPEDQQMFWDPNDAVFVPINARNDDTSTAFKDLAIEIRVDQYQGAMAFFLKELENELHLSEGTFTQTPTGVQTATEVVTNNSKTYQTRSSYLTMFEKTIDQLVYAIAELLATPELWSDGKPRWSGDVDKLVITPDFNDGVFVDQEAQRASDLQAVQAGILPKKQFLIRNYGLSDQEADKWLKQVQDEQSPEPPDQEMSMFPSEGGGVSEQEDKPSADNEAGRSTH